MILSGNKIEKVGTTPGIFVRGLTVPTSCRDCGFRHGEQCWAVSDDQENVLEPRELLGDLRAPFCPIEEVRCRSQLFWHEAKKEKPNNDRTVLIVVHRAGIPFEARWNGKRWEEETDICYWEKTAYPALMWADLPENPLKNQEVAD